MTETSKGYKRQKPFSYTDVSYHKPIQKVKTRKYYKKYLYSLWVLPKPINYTKNIYIVYGF